MGSFGLLQRHMSKDQGNFWTCNIVYRLAQMIPLEVDSILETPEMK